jgi:hypothetical protein
LRRNLLCSLRTFSASVLVIAACTFAQAAAAARDWQPQRTWVFVVGLLKFQHRDMFNSFPQTNRRDAQLVEFFRQQGVPDEQIVFLKDAQATSRRVENSFPAFLSKAGPNDFLFFYYTGHGYKSEDERTTYFATYDAGDDVDGWSTDSIVRDVEKYFKGTRALLTADTCYSGSLTANVQRLGRRVSYASLTSSSANHTSTENWTFTEMLLAGLRGESFADTNGDGEVSLTELADDVKEDMAFAEQQRSTFAITGNFPSGMLIAPAARKIDPLISQRVQVRSEGDWYKARVIDVHDNTYRVHYFGFEDSDDEWVTLRQIRNLRTAASSAMAGARVEAEWQDTQNSRPKISKVDQGFNTNHNKRYEGGWDESVIPKRKWPGSNSKWDARQRQ